MNFIKPTKYNNILLSAEGITVVGELNLPTRISPYDNIIFFICNNNYADIYYQYGNEIRVYHAFYDEEMFSDRQANDYIKILKTEIRLKKFDQLF